MGKTRKLDARNQKRLNFWKEIYDDRVLDVYDSREYLDVTSSRGTYRVRGNGRDNYTITER